MAQTPSGDKNYAGNSNRDKVGADIPNDLPEKKVEAVVTSGAIERKKPLGRRIAASFTGDDAQSVGHYVMFDVILPQLKELIFDAATSAFQRLLFGDKAVGKAYSGTRARGYTPYGSMAQGAISKVAAQATKAVMPEPSNEFGEILLPTRPDAQAVYDRIENLIETYGTASVADLKACVGMTGSFTDNSFGWTHMGGTGIRRVGGGQPGYALIFPQPQELN